MSRKTGGIHTFVCSFGCGQLPIELFVWHDAPTQRCPTCGRDTAIKRESRHACAPEAYSEAMGIHPNQIAEAQRLFPHHRFTPDGRLIYQGQREKDRVMKDLGMVEYATKNDLRLLKHGQK